MPARRRPTVWRWGLGFAILYLVVAVPCAVLYLNWSFHEYSIPGFILVCAGLPVYWLLTGTLGPLLRRIGQLDHGVAILITIHVVITAGFYFGVGCATGLVRRLLHRGRPENRRP